MPFHDDHAALKRIDLHCHSSASNLTSEAVLNAIKCPESYSDPNDVHAQATRRGMDFVTLTDHDTINGALAIARKGNVIIGEELTCWFPEDGCKMHVLVWGITQSDHDHLQAIANDIYQVAAYVEENRLAHAVAHPLYRQNDKLERWHLERLILMFKGFECLNGSHSALHRDAFEPTLNRLDRAYVQKLSEKHLILPRWNEPWVKARTAGSDDHGLLNVGRTWTEFPADVKTTDDVLRCLREGTCRPGGEAGSSVKLAHNFFGVAIRYYSRHILEPTKKKPNLATLLLQTMVGERKAPDKGELIRLAVRHKLKKWRNLLLPPILTKKGRSGDDGTAKLLRDLFIQSTKSHLPGHTGLRAALDAGLPPFGEHAEMFQFVSTVNRDVTRGIAEAIDDAVDNARFTGLFDSISAALAQQFVLLPYYFAFFHQNRERNLLRTLTGDYAERTAESLRVGLFTDTFDEINGVGRFIRDMGEQAARKERRFVVHTCTSAPRLDLPYRKNFEPLLSRHMPYYPELQLNLPPITEIMDWADRQQFDAIHISTPGPMGLAGWIVAKMLRVPILGTYHTDFPAYVERLTGDHRMAGGTVKYMQWFYRQMANVFSRSHEYRASLLKLGVEEPKLRTTLPGINTDKFNPKHRDESIWQRRGIGEPKRILYVGRISVEKNLPLLVEAYRRLVSSRKDVALVVAGDGPYLETMRQALAGTPAYFLGYQNDSQLGTLYASSDLFVFPSRTDTLGQVVMEAQASGVPVLVSDEGGPKEMMDDGVTGHVLPGDDAALWCKTIDDLLNDEPRRQRMVRTAPQRIQRFSLETTFESFWAEHVTAAEPPYREPVLMPPSPAKSLKV